MILKLEKKDISKEYSYGTDFMPFIILEKSSYYESQIKNTTTLPKGKKKEQIERNAEYKKIAKEIENYFNHIKKGSVFNVYNNDIELYKQSEFYKNDFIKDSFYKDRLILHIKPIQLKRNQLSYNSNFITNEFEILEVIEDKQKFIDILKEEYYINDYLQYIFNSYYCEETLELAKLINQEFELSFLFKENIYNFNQYCEIGNKKQVVLRDLVDLGHIKLKEDYSFKTQTFKNLLNVGAFCVAYDYLISNREHNPKEEIMIDSRITEYLKSNISNEKARFICDELGIAPKRKKLIVTNCGEYYDSIKEEIILLDDDEVKQYLIKKYDFKFKEINSIYPKILNCDYYINNLIFEVENNE